jgi:WD40 repeat protein
MAFPPVALDHGVLGDRPGGDPALPAATPDDALHPTGWVHAGSPAGGDLCKVAFVASETQRLVTGMSFSSCDMYLATAGEDDLLRVVAAGPGNESAAAGGSLLLAQYYLESSGVTHVAYSPQLSDHVYVTPRSRNASDVYRVNLERGTINGAYHAMEKGGADVNAEADEVDFTALAHSPTSAVFAAAKESGYCSFFHPTVAQAVATLDRPLAGSGTCAFSSDGNRFVFGDKFCVAAYDWRVLARGPFSVQSALDIDRDGNVYGLEFHPRDSDRVLATSTNMVLAEVSLQPGGPKPRCIFQERDEVHDELSVLNLHYMAYKRRLQCTARYSPTGDVVAVGTAASALLLLDVRRNYSLAQKAVRCHRATVSGVCWNPQYDLLATSCQNVQLWALDSTVSDGVEV